VENLYKNFIKIDIMSDLNLENIVGFKAVDKDGNEQNVTVDEMVDMVSTRMVMALSETSTFAAAAATGNDVYENELPTVTDAANVRVLQSSGDAAKMTMQSLASKLGELMNSLGLFPFMFRGIMTNRSYNDLIETGYYKIQDNMIDGPSTYWGTLVVFNDSDQITQVFYPNIDSTEISTRKGNINNFVKSAWRIISFT
jgi:hypothetical protein